MKIDCLDLNTLQCLLPSRSILLEGPVLVADRPSTSPWSHRTKAPRTHASRHVLSGHQTPQAMVESLLPSYGTRNVCSEWAA